MCPCWVTQSSIDPFPRSEPVDDGEDGRAALGPLLAQRLLFVRVRRVEAHDHRVDLPAVDPSGIVDLIHEEVNRLGLLAELGVGLDLELTLDAAERNEREDHVDAAGRDAPCAGAGLGDRRRGAGGPRRGGETESRHARQHGDRSHRPGQPSPRCRHSPTSALSTPECAPFGVTRRQRLSPTARR